jgi:hypothetical protein
MRSFILRHIAEKGSEYRRKNAAPTLKSQWHVAEKATSLRRKSDGVVFLSRFRRDFSLFLAQESVKFKKAYCKIYSKHYSPTHFVRYQENNRI